MDMARLTEQDDPSSVVEFQFNPETISFNKKANWEQQQTQSASNAPNAHFTGTGPTDLNLKLLLDETEAADAAAGATESVAERVERLVRWTCPAEGTTDTTSPKPPLVVFSWGELSFGVEDTFVGYVTEVGITYTLFLPTGQPVRAEATVKLTAILQEPAGQNPTSGGLMPWKSRTFHRGDSLSSVAHQEYGNPRYWRHVAEANGIEDPLRLRAGDHVLLPLREELDRRRRDGRPTAGAPRG